MNSFVVLEKGPIKAFEEGSGNPPVYAVGPVITTGSSSEENGSDCLRWLDNQPPKSVLFVSFGSGGTLSQEQLNELALGLEQSGKKFLWVVRAPSNPANAAYLGAKNEDPLQFLPSGFMDRTKDQGLVIPPWAPQIQVLSHNAIGGFLSSWAPQKMNAVMLSDELKVALRPKANEKGIVEREEIAKVIRRFMEGEEGKDI